MYSTCWNRDQDNFKIQATIRKHLVLRGRNTSGYSPIVVKWHDWRAATARGRLGRESQVSPGRTLKGSS